MSSVSIQQMFAAGGKVGVKCRASRGALPHEVGVVIKGAKQYYEALLEDDLVETHSEVSDESQDGVVSAKVVKTNGANLLVELPRQVVTGGRRIWIPKSEAT